MIRTRRRQIWLGQRGDDLLSFVDLWPVTDVFCKNDSVQLREYEASSKVEVFSVERIKGVREPASYEDCASLFSQCRTKADQQNTIILPYYAVEAPSGFAGEIWSPQYGLVHMLANRKLGEDLLITRGLGQFFLPQLTLDEARLCVDAGESVTITASVSSSGSGVYLIDSQAAMIEVLGRLGQSGALLRPFRAGPTFNVQCVINPSGGYVATPSMQLIDITEEANYRRFAYLGNVICSNDAEYCAMSALVQHVAAATVPVLINLGYKGLIGYDILSDGKSAWILDINPRFQNSTPLLDLFEHGHGMDRTVELHLDAFRLECPSPPMIGTQTANTPASSVAMICLIIKNDLAERRMRHTPEQARRSVKELRDSINDSDDAATRSLVDQVYHSSIGLGFPVTGTLVRPKADLGRLYAVIKGLTRPLATQVGELRKAGLDILAQACVRLG